MDRTETYIKMCDCPEIQSLWNPKGADFFWNKVGHVTWIMVERHPTGNHIDNLDIDGTTVTFIVGTPAGSGYLGRVPFNPNMSFGRAISSRVHPIIASIDNGKFFIGWDLYTTAFESAVRDAVSDNIFIRLAGSSALTDASVLTQTFRVIGEDTIGTSKCIFFVTRVIVLQFFLCSISEYLGLI